MRAINIWRRELLPLNRRHFYVLDCRKQQTRCFCGTQIFFTVTKFELVFFYIMFKFILHTKNRKLQFLYNLSSFKILMELFSYRIKTSVLLTADVLKRTKFSVVSFSYLQFYILVIFF